MKLNRTLSIELRELMTEAKALLDIKAELDGYPKDFKNPLQTEIEDWFKAAGDERRRTKAEANANQGSERGIGGGELPTKDTSPFLDKSKMRFSMVDEVPNDDDIPF